MITIDELKKQISVKISKGKIIELSRLLKIENFALRNLIDLSFDKNKHIAFRTAWILENLFLKDPDFYEQDIEYMLNRFPNIKHGRCQRHYTKILMHLTNPNVSAMISSKIASINLDALVEKCFDWLIDPQVKTAVKVFACNALFNLRNNYHVIKDELENQINFLITKNASPGIISKGKKLLIKLRQY